MNTLVKYLYRDASNYKTTDHVIFRGTLTQQQISDIMAHCDERQYFIPGQVGMQDLQSRLGGLNDDDHAWHTLTEIAETDRCPTEERSAEAFYREFMATVWDDAYFAGMVLSLLPSAPEDPTKNTVVTITVQFDRNIEESVHHAVKALESIAADALANRGFCGLTTTHESAVVKVSVRRYEDATAHS